MMAPVAALSVVTVGTSTYSPPRHPTLISRVRWHSASNICQTLGDGSDGVPVAVNALELVMRAWCGAQPDVQGAFDIKLTTSALAVLLQTGNPALGTVGVKGELIEAGMTGSVHRVLHCVASTVTPCNG